MLEWDCSVSTQQRKIVTAIAGAERKGLAGISPAKLYTFLLSYPCTNSTSIILDLNIFLKEIQNGTNNISGSNNNEKVSTIVP